MTLEEEELSLRIVEDDEAISTALEEDSSSISVSLAEALSLSQATSIAVKAKVPRKNLAKFIKTSRINLIGMNVKKVRIAADFFEAFEACDLTKASDDIEYAWATETCKRPSNFEGKIEP